MSACFSCGAMEQVSRYPPHGVELCLTCYTSDPAIEASRQAMERLAEHEHRWESIWKKLWRWLKGDGG